jgi:hypothetical protein
VSYATIFESTICTTRKCGKPKVCLTPLKSTQLKAKRSSTRLFTDANGNTIKVVAFSPRQLAPVSYFIQNVNTCTKKLLMRVPLRMAMYGYSCPTGTYKYTTFGTVGHLITTAEVVR